MLDDTFAGFGWPTQPGDRRTWSPLADIEETDDAYVVEVDLPSVKAEDISAELVGNELRIAGQLKEREHSGTMRRRTRRTGRFSYRVALPSSVDGERIEANLSDGMLTVRVPKGTQDEAHKIEIKTEG
jgi:HSP20 family protein